MTPRIPTAVVHYGLNDPREATGGVETFARNLAIAFEEVVFMTPATRDEQLVVERGLPVVCDNQWVLDWPERIPVIGFQHGVAARKLLAIPGYSHADMALKQRRAAKRANTLWVACARWISDAFGTLHGNRAAHVVYHAVDLERFDGRLDNEGSTLLLHDGRVPHKGSKLYPALERAFGDWRFEPLACKPTEVADRMRQAAAFVHLSRYEGNSIVCNEAMAMDLPCLFTRVGLMNDGAEQFDVQVIEAGDAFGGERKLVDAVRSFVESLAVRRYHPRAWVEEHASLDANRKAWRAVMKSFSHLRWS